MGGCGERRSSDEIESKLDHEHSGLPIAGGHPKEHAVAMHTRENFHTSEVGQLRFYSGAEILHIDI